MTPTKKLVDEIRDLQAQAAGRDKFESWLKDNGDALFWNTSDAMYLAWLSGQKQVLQELRQCKPEDLPMFLKEQAC